MLYTLIIYNFYLKMYQWGTCVAQSVKPPTFDFYSDYDLQVLRLSPESGSMLGVGPG